MTDTETIAGFLADLKDDGFVCYAYIGGEKDEGWGWGRAAHSLLAQVNIYRFDDYDALRPYIGKKRPAAVVFGWGDDVVALLSATAAEDLENVIDSIRTALTTERVPM